MRFLKDSFLGLEDPIEIVRKIQEFTFSDEFDRYCMAEAGKMVTHLFTDAGRTWRQAAKANGQGQMIYNALMKEMQGPMGYIVNDLTRSNARLIKTLPLDIARHVNQHILNESLKGKRASDIANEIKLLFPAKSKARANLIARTEVGKTSTALTQARSEILNIPAYIWRTSEDQRVRDAHQLMEGVIIFWDDAPNPERLDHEKNVKHGPYQAGCIWNCRCYPEPIINLDLVKWPAKVHYHGQIVRMARKQFERLIKITA